MTAIIFTTNKPIAQRQPTTWSSITAPNGNQFRFRSLLEISPNGRHLAFIAPNPDQKADRALWIRDLDSNRARPIAGTAGAEQPFWSPDSKFVAFFADRELRKVAVDGGVPTKLCAIGSESRGGSWSRDGTILFVPDWSVPIYRVPETGGTPEQVTTLSTERLELSHRWPHFLPDGKHFLFYAVSTYPEINPENPSDIDQSGLFIGSLDGMEPRLLQSPRSRARYIDGNLLYVDDGILMARPFDPEALEFKGEPIPLVEDVTQSVGALWGAALFSVSDEGTMTLVSGAAESRTPSNLVWFDRKGNEVGRVGEAAVHGGIRLSYDGKRLAYFIDDPGDVWIQDLAREVPTRFTFDQGNDSGPIWSPDDKTIVFASSRVISGKRFAVANLMARATSGLEPVEHLVSPEWDVAVRDWSPDGSVILVRVARPGTGTDLMLYRVEDKTLTPLLETEYNETSGRFSPDGKWIAYESDESGIPEIYVRSFPGTGGLWQISKGGGEYPVWRRDGKELFYLDSDSNMTAVPIDTTDGFTAGTPVKLFPTRLTLFDRFLYSYDISADGERFLVMEPVDKVGDADVSVMLVQGWERLLD